MKDNYCDIYKKHYGDIPAGFDIHHIDGNHNNNSISNLEALSKSEHLRKHAKMSKKNGFGLYQNKYKKSRRASLKEMDLLLYKINNNII